MADETAATGPEIIWIWNSPRLGWLATAIGADGEVRQGRQYGDGTPSRSVLGTVSATEAARLHAMAIKVLASEKDRHPALAEEEWVELGLREGNEVERVAVPVKELAAHAPMVEMRRAIVAVRRQTGGGFFLWRSPGGRLFYLLMGLMACFAWWIVRDWRAGSRMEREALRVTGTVTGREGSSGTDRNKFITAAFAPQAAGPVQSVKIADYLSAEHWQAARPGSTVALWHLAATGQTYLEDDIRRWNQDKKWIIMLPLGIAACLFPVIFILRRYRVGVHDDGQEYMTEGDRVATDDKAALINRTQANAARLLFRVLGK